MHFNQRSFNQIRIFVTLHSADVPLCCYVDVDFHSKFLGEQNLMQIEDSGYYALVFLLIFIVLSSRSISRLLLVSTQCSNL